MATRKYELQINREEHDEDLLAKKTSVVSSATIFTVSSIQTGDIEIGAVELKDHDSDDRAEITTAGEVAVKVRAGNVTVEQGDDPWNVTAIGNVTVQAVNLDIRDLSASQDNVAITGNVTLSDSKTTIGLVSLAGGAAWADPKAGIGLVSVFGGKVTLETGVAEVGFATVSNADLAYSYKYTSGPTTDWIVKGSAGFLHAIHVGAAVASSIIEVSDHASDGDGAVKIYQAGDTIGPAVYPLNMTMDTGITLDITNQTHVTVIYR